MIWNFLLPYINNYDDSIFLQRSFVKPGIKKPVFQIAPAIDPLTVKNHQRSEKEGYLFYFIIFVILVSFMIGFAAYYALQGFIWLILPKYKNEFRKALKAKKNLKRLHIARKDLILLRHLLISIFILGWILPFYLSKFIQLELGVWSFILLQFFVLILLTEVK